MANERPARAGKHDRVVRAPSGLRAVVELDELERMVAAVDDWRGVEAKVTAARIGMVRDLRQRGASWDSIGWLLGVTGTGARKRYQADVP